MSTDSFQNGRSKAEAELSTKFANAGVKVQNEAWIQEVGHNEFNLVVDGKRVFTGKSQKECMEWVKANGITGRIDYSDK
jgi:hypothetical protein